MTGWTTAPLRRRRARRGRAGRRGDRHDRRPGRQVQGAGATQLRVPGVCRDYPRTASPL